MKNTGVRKVLFAFLWLTAAIQIFADKTFSENGFTYTIMEDSCSLSLVSYQATAKTDFTLPLHIPASVTHEGKTYPVKRIESNAFKGVTAVQSIIVEEGIETILDYAFECCTNLRSISIPASAEGIGKGLKQSLSYKLLEHDITKLKRLQSFYLLNSHPMICSSFANK